VSKDSNRLARPAQAARQQSGGLAQSAAPGRVRIIGGQWKRTPLQVPAVPGLRPTPDRVRETLFNWLGQSLEGWRCLDLFAGSGALGLEAASRGAARVVLVERDRAASRLIAQALSRLAGSERVALIEADAQRALSDLKARDEPRFDLVFLDPPFSEDWVTRLWPAIEVCVADSGLIYVESDRAFDPVPPPWRIERAGRAGQVHYHLLRRASIG